MIANITKGRKATGAILYDFGPGRRDEHINPRLVAGNVVGTPMQVARMIDHIARQRPEIKNPIWRTSLSLPDEDGILPDGQWQVIAEDFIEAMGFAGAPWVAVRHGDDHIHLTVSRVDWGGQLLTDRWDFRRAREIADRLEQEHNLVRARDRFKAEGPMVRNAELEASNRRRGPNAAVPPEREELRRIIREVRDASRGLGPAAFEAGLEDAGVSSRANVASTGRMSGYSFTLEGWTDADGAQIWVPASKVAKDLRWAELHPVLGDDPVKPTIPDPRTELALAAAATSTALQDAEGLSPDELAAGAERAAELLRQGQAERGFLPDQPQPVGSSTDPAAILLAQWKAIRAGEPVLADKVPTGPSAFPAWTDRARRPHGALGNDTIAASLKKREKELPLIKASLVRAEQQIRTGDAIATGQVTGPNIQQLHQLLDKLEKAEPHITAAREHREGTKAAREATVEARKEFWEATGLKDKSRWELWRMGTSRSAETTRASEAGTAIHENSELERTERKAWGKAEDAAREQTGLRDPSGELDRLRTNWPELVADAQQRDQIHGKALRTGGRADVDKLNDSLRTVERRIDKLTQEQTLRKTMPEGQRLAEGRARSAAARPDPEAPKKKAGARRPSPQYDRPAHLRNQPPQAPGPRRGL